MIRQDWFLDRACTLLQDTDGFCFNTDTALLAQFAKVRSGESVLDIGTNNGVLLKWFLQYRPSLAVGIEVQEPAAQIARKNLEDQAQIITGKVQDLKLDPFDVIVTNPPYFPKGEGKPDARRRAREEWDLDLEALAFHAGRLLKSNGRLYLVHRPDRLEAIIVQLHKNNLGLKTLCLVRDVRDGTVKSILVEAIKERHPQTTVTIQEIGHGPA